MSVYTDYDRKRDELKDDLRDCLSKACLLYTSDAADDQEVV